MATISRLLKNIGLFGRKWSLLWDAFAKETYVLKLEDGTAKGECYGVAAMISRLLTNIRQF